MTSPQQPPPEPVRPVDWFRRCPQGGTTYTPRPSTEDTVTVEHVEQPMPTPNGHVSIQSLVRADLEAREQVGIQRYGTALQPHNGRDALRDAYEEALDLACYLKQAMVERDNAPRWMPGDMAAWRGRLVEVMTPPGRQVIRLANGSEASVSPEELQAVRGA